MRIGWMEVRLRLRARDWVVELWQWPHQDFVKRHKVKTVFFGIQVGPVDVGFWTFRPGQYALVPAEERDPAALAFSKAIVHRFRAALRAGLGSVSGRAFERFSPK